ncbi:MULTISPECIES: ABC transporter substrate-binding protein [Paenibacillus]|uniref:ABC transporter substrate-binding protein n=1 Tax=Paenibacillus TaxID=44249 RepID=UPI0013E928D4|nr:MULTISPECIES: ABC transporter substrate-binding protein [Paenibacillus]KAF6580504.1 ABC transporter substrate-binding protein [Paenibacillus sp. EKM211P]
MQHLKISPRLPVLMSVMLIIAIVLSACSSQENGAQTSLTAGQATNSTDQKEMASTTPTTREYTDFQKRKVAIPVNPQKIVYVGSDPGDLLALGVRPAGASLSVIQSQIVYADLTKDIIDIGSPVNLEKLTMLKPDLILFDNWDVKTIDTLAKIASTVVLNSELATFERMQELGKLLGKTKEADRFKTLYDEKAKQMKAKLDVDIKPGETATVLLVMGDNLYVMGHQGISVSLYDMLGFIPAHKVQTDLIDKKERFATISSEVLPSFIGDELFILSDQSEETIATTRNLMNSEVWKTIPAVQNKRVYTLDSSWNFDDAITRERLLEQIPDLMKQK